MNKEPHFVNIIDQIVAVVVAVEVIVAAAGIFEGENKKDWYSNILCLNEFLIKLGTCAAYRRGDGQRRRKKERERMLLPNIHLPPKRNNNGFVLFWLFPSCDRCIRE